jgi:hypothetical protein
VIVGLANELRRFKPATFTHLFVLLLTGVDSEDDEEVALKFICAESWSTFLCSRQCKVTQLTTGMPVGIFSNQK